jgi:virginiamycin B lyase
MLSTFGRFAGAILLLSWPAVAPAQQVVFVSYVVPAANTVATGIATGPDGALWFTAWPGNAILRITTSGVATSYPVPTAKSQPQSITAGPDGALWFTEQAGNQIGRITTAGAITEFPIPTPNSQPNGITAGRDGALWFTEWNGNRIGRITTAGAIAEFPLPPGRNGPGAIVAGSDGALWFARGVEIGRITTAGSTTQYTVATPAGTITAWINSLAIGPNSALWFTSDNIDSLGIHTCDIGFITTAGAITQYPVSGCAYAITPGADGGMWFTNINSVGRITAAGVVTEYPLPNIFGDDPEGFGITVGPDGELWFVNVPGQGYQQFSPDSIGEVLFVNANLSVSPDSGFYRTSHTFTGSGFAPNETVRIYARKPGSGVLATAMTDSTGAFTASARVPLAPYGPLLFLAASQGSEKLAAVNLNVTANVVLDRDSGPPGSSVTAAGYGFPASAQIQVYWGEPRTLLGTVTADVNGSFAGSAALTFTVPAGAATGANTILGTWVCSTWPPTCPSDSGSGSFTVE